MKQLFNVPSSELSDVLEKLNILDFKWQTLLGGVSIDTFFHEATSRDYGSMTPVLNIEVSVGKDTGKVYRFVTLTTDKLLKHNSDKRYINDFGSLDLLLENGFNEIIVLESLKFEIEKDRKIVTNMAENDDYKQGYLKAMTNVMSVINEKLRVTVQGGDPTIRV